MALPHVRVAIVLLAGALAGCQAAPPALTGARMAFDRPRYRRSAADVKLAGNFLPAAAARAAASGPGVPDPAVRGTVVGVSGTAEAPLEGALVTTSDGRAGLSGPDGAFAIAGAMPADGGLVATHDGYVAAAVAGLAPGVAPALRLRARTREAEGQPAAAEAPFPVTGRVVGPGGAPAGNTLVVLEDAAGAFSAPTLTDADGRFMLTVFAPGRAVADATVLAVGQGEPAWIGARTGVAADAGRGDVGEVAVEAAAMALEVAIDAAAMPGAPVRTTLALAMPDGASLALPARGTSYRVAAPPGATYVLLAEAEDVGAGTSSAVRRVVAPDAGRVDAALLAPPADELDAALVLNEALAWRPVPGARGYQVTLAAIGGGGFLWEGVSAAPALPFSFQGELPDGLYGLTITAWDAEGGLPPAGGSWRRSARQARLVI